MERFSCKMAIAPTASISIICGGTSACIEPIPANIYTHKTLSGSFSIKNPYLEKLLRRRRTARRSGRSILEQRRLGPAPRLPHPGGEGRLQDQLRDRPALADRARRRPHPLYRPGQSLNLFIPADVDKWDLLMLHYRAWERGIKSLYYLRSKSVQRAGFAGGVEADNTPRSSCRRRIMTSAWPAVLLLVAAAIFLAIGCGYDPRSLLR
jgi:ribonucleoside-diphosphate reductase alpha chain